MRSLLLASSLLVLFLRVPPATAQIEEATPEAPAELVRPAIPEGYVGAVRAGANAGRATRQPGVMDAPEPQPAPLRASDPVDRFFLELGGAVIAVGAATALGYAVELLERNEESRVASMLTFTYLMLPSFSWLGGSIVGGGEGTWGGAFIGDSIGASLGGLLAWWATEERSEEGVWVALLLTPALGTVLGLELQHVLRVEQHERDVARTVNEAVARDLSLSVTPTRGGMLVGLRGRF